MRTFIRFLDKLIALKGFDPKTYMRLVDIVFIAGFVGGASLVFAFLHA